MSESKLSEVMRDHETNQTSEGAQLVQDEMDDLTQEERRKANGVGDPRTSEMAVGVIKDEIDNLSDDDSDLVIDEPPEEDMGGVESDKEERSMEEADMKPSLPSFSFLADQRALLQPKTDLQKRPEQAIQPKPRASGVVGDGGVGVGAPGVAADSRPPTTSSSQLTSSPAPSHFNFNLDILATVASMNRYTNHFHFFVSI